MSEQTSTDQPGFTGNLRTLLQHGAGLLSARLSLALIELAEARDALLLVVLLGVAALMMAGFALIALSALIVVLTWDMLGWYVILWLALGYALISALLLWAVRRLIRKGRLGLPQTLAELRQDREALFPRDAS